MTGEIDKFARRVQTTLEAKAADQDGLSKSARRVKERLRAQFHDGYKTGLHVAVSVLRRAAERWKP